MPAHAMPVPLLSDLIGTNEHVDLIGPDSLFLFALEYGEAINARKAFFP